MEGLLLRDPPLEGGKNGPHLKHVDVLGGAPPVPARTGLPLPEGGWQAGPKAMIPQGFLRLGLNHDILALEAD